MVVLQQYYQIVEQDTANISPLWKVAHTITCVVAALSGFITAFTFGYVLSDFSYNCVLNANLVFEESYLNASYYKISKPVHAIDLTASVWGPNDDCIIAQFTPLATMISAIVLGTYFAVMSKGGAGYPTDLFPKTWSTIYPCTFFTLIFFIIYVVSAIRLESGIKEFCLQFKSEFNNTECVPDINAYVEQFQKKENTSVFGFFANISVALTSSTVGIWSWVFQILLYFVRVFGAVDFNLQLITISAKEEEQVEKVVDFTESYESIDKNEDSEV